ncbi:cupin domain-containing protein [Leptolyngbya sp. 15MV]|nr:cupin domain-containing protein [Leptolyngbya sp. 15MV]
MPRHTVRDIVEEVRGADEVCGPSRSYSIGDAGGLTQFGAILEVLPPGSRTSLTHWHAAEDELVYVLEGQVTLVEGEAETVLGTGDAATFKAGVPIGHHLENRGGAEARILVVGTRAPVEAITYPHQDRVCHRDRSLPHDVWTDGSGRPAPNPYG